MVRTLRREGHRCPFPAPRGRGRATAYPAPVAKPVKLSTPVDSTLEADLVPLTPGVVDDPFARHKRSRGESPHRDHELSPDQLGAVLQLVNSNHVPYVDFPLFGQHGRCMARTLSHIAHQCEP